MLVLHTHVTSPEGAIVASFLKLDPQNSTGNIWYSSKKSFGLPKPSLLQRSTVLQLENSSKQKNIRPERKIHQGAILRELKSK